MTAPAPVIEIIVGDPHALLRKEHTMTALKSFTKIALLFLVMGTACATTAYACTCETSRNSCTGTECGANNDDCFCAA
jgi:hypothetical protein